MDTTDKITVTELTNVDGELLPVETKPRKQHASPCENDEAYILAYIENPHLGKAHAYKTATGDDTPYLRQRAYNLHQRLHKQIDDRLRERILGCVTFGMNRLIDLAVTADSQSVQAAASSKLIELGLKCSPPDISVREERSRDEIIADIQSTRERIEALGTKI